METEVLFRRGGFIDCAACGATVWRASCEGIRGGLAYAHMFTGVPPHRDPQTVDRFSCPACGNTVMLNERTGEEIKTS